MRRPWPAYLSYPTGVLFVVVTIIAIIAVASYQDRGISPSHRAADDLHPAHKHPPAPQSF